MVRLGSGGERTKPEEPPVTQASWFRGLRDVGGKKLAMVVVNSITET